MALQYTLVFILLLVEMALFAIISLPLPPFIRKPLLNSLNMPFHSEHFQIFFRCAIAFIGILFLDSLNRMRRVTNELYYDKSGSFGGSMDSQMGSSMGSSMGSQMGPVGSSRTEVQTRRFYSQRNVYLCGLTLFLSLIVKRTYDLVYELLAVKEQIASKEKSSKLDELDDIDDEKMVEIRAKIAAKNKEVDTLKKQAEALSRDYKKI
ncbi:hypothetical protein FOA43_001808 [Brettanomyces nanus]|uniref:Endoplasmic reticulum transmembrane protein n=1 Tax=Eeniella nana TaxID=13502 RepID=A0A875S0I8_EENNA|nr:uncharacterized protein FOA43_001808 [Brettanomyces nanus]QPG74478.1 hypothetical protein FOA43_001808 [Brettanomyces nanus]